MTRAVIYVAGPVRAADHDVGRQKKLQACRAYCARLGYEVAAVVTAPKPKPYAHDEAMRVYEQGGRDALRAFFAAQPHHPEDDADALLESGAVDVKVEFRGIGDSGPFDWGYTPELQERLPPPPRIEMASLWEIEPPTPEHRQRYYWTREDMARRARGERTRAVAYVRADATWRGREAATAQEHYCRGYCTRAGYDLAEVYRDTILVPGTGDGSGGGDDDERPELRRAVDAVREGRAHLLVTLDEGVLAADAEGLAAVREQVPRIEYAQSYAADVQLTAFVEAMQRLKAVFERIDGAREAGVPPAEPAAPDQEPAPAPAPSPAARPPDFDDAFAAFPDLETPGLRLRRPLPVDAGALRAIYADAIAAHPAPLASDAHAHGGAPADVGALLDIYRRGFEEHTALSWALARKPGDTPLGMCGFVNFEREARRALLTFVVGRTRWRQALMREAVRAVLAFGFERLGLRRVVAVVVGDNAPARALLTKLGFTPEGRLRERWLVGGQVLDEQHFGLLRADDRTSRLR